MASLVVIWEGPSVHTSQVHRRRPNTIIHYTLLDYVRAYHERGLAPRHGLHQHGAALCLVVCLIGREWVE